MSCNGPCQQGRITCPTPDACNLDDPSEHRSHEATSVFLAAVLAAAVIITALLIANIIKP